MLKILIMRKTKLSLIMDFIFGTVFTFLICFIWVRYFVHNIYLNLLICTALTFLVVASFHLYKKKQTEKQFLSAKEQNLAINSANFFITKGNKNTVKIFEEILKQKYFVKS